MRLCFPTYFYSTVLHKNTCSLALAVNKLQPEIVCMHVHNLFCFCFLNFHKIMCSLIEIFTVNVKLLSSSILSIHIPLP